MAKPWKTIPSKLSNQRREDIREAARRDPAVMRLAELRKARHLSQQALADAMETAQPEVSRIENSAELYLGTLRRYVEAIGGKLELVVRFGDDAEYRLEQFEDLDETPRNRERAAATAGRRP
jgi:transcriptional regulator with XRE-family HTH domain